MLLDFETAAKARICCMTGECFNCPINDDGDAPIKCADVTMSDEMVGWLATLLDRLDQLGKRYEDVDDDEFMFLISGVAGRECEED